MRRLAIGLLATVAGIACRLAASPARRDAGDRAAAVGARPTPTRDRRGRVDVLQVSGLFDPIVVDAIDDGHRARRRRRLPGARSSRSTRRAPWSADDEIEELLEQIADAPVPIGVWVGPTGARLYGTPAQLLAVADVTGMAPGRRDRPHRRAARAPTAPTVDFGVADDALRSGSLGLSATPGRSASSSSGSRRGDPDDHEHGRGPRRVQRGRRRAATRPSDVVLDDGTVRRDTIATVRFSKLGLVDQLFHTVASPAVAYLLLLIGLALLVFEFFTAGVGVAGVVGAACIVLACTGLAALPARGWAVGLIVAAMLAFAVDVQVGIPRFWTGVGIVAHGRRQPVAVRAAPGRHAAAVVDHAARRASAGSCWRSSSACRRWCAPGSRRRRSGASG